ncbi:MAG: tetratricopeptide repeat protein [Deltaproteobacteria bacterium]|nr:tetratricopeptide repeat protein [Deltaproteobacteria bacterium]
MGTTRTTKQNNRDQIKKDITSLRRNGRHEKAISVLESAAENTQGEESAVINLMLGEVLSDTGRHEKAEAILEASYQFFLAEQNQTFIALSAAAIAENLRRQRGDQNQQMALELLREADKRQTRRYGLAKCRLALAEGRILLERREYLDAYERLKAAYSLAGSRKSERAAAARSIGLFFGAIGRTEQAGKWFEIALELYVTEKDYYGQARACGELGRLLLDQGNHDAALGILKRGLAAARKLTDQYQLAHILNDLGRAHAGLGREETAVSLFEECLQISRASGLKLVEAFAIKNLAKITWRKGELGNALDMLDNVALPSFTRLNNKFGLAVASRLRGRILRDMGAEKRAAEAFGLAQNDFEAVDALRQVATTKYDRAKLLGDRLRREPGNTELVEKTTSLLDEALGLARSLADNRLIERINSLLENANLDAAVKRHVAFIAGREQESKAAVLGGRKEVLTILVADLQGFTAYSADRDPKEVLDTLNDYFGALGEVIREYNGLVDKYLGDGLMVLFRGDSGGHHPYRAVKAALAMLGELDKFNKNRRLAKSLPPLETRIGINTGEAVVGNTGTYERMQLTAVGSTVNLAFRLEDQAPTNAILAGPATYRHLGGHFNTRKEAPFVPKGFNREISPYVILGERDLVRFRPKFHYPDSKGVKYSHLTIGLGPGEESGSIDRRSFRQETASTAALIYMRPSLVLNNIQNMNIRHTAITLPSPLSFDHLVSAFFSQELIEHGVLPRGAPWLASYTELCSMMLLPVTSEPWNTPLGIFIGLCERNRMHGTPRSEGDLYLLKRGMYLCEYTCALVEEMGCKPDASLILKANPFEREGEIFRNRFQEMMANDMRYSKKSFVRLPSRTGKKKKEVTCLHLSDPSPMVQWIRHNADPGKPGEKPPALLVVNYTRPKRTLISLDGKSGATLNNLTTNLNRLEKDERQRLKHTPLVDGWIIMGRSDNYGIALESPAGGSILSFKQILSALGARRRPAGKKRH